MSKEIRQIFQKINNLAPHENAVLATVVAVKGSSYRLPGAKMLILKNDKTFGTISGGCLEADVLERAKKVWQTNEPQIFTYDTTEDENSVFSLNMGCRGVIRILLESVRANKFIELFQNCIEQRKKAVTATLIASENAGQIGTRMFFDESGKVENNFDENQAEQILDESRRVLTEEKSILHTYEFGEVFYEYLEPTVALAVFGAGADGVPLAEIAKNLGWNVSIVDHRPAFVTTERFSTADRLILHNAENLPEIVEFDNRTAAVVMTHNYDRDRQILANLLNTEVFYVGALGPKRRTENLLRELRETGGNFSESKLGRLYAPVGLDIGADTPESIALSIVAEIQTVLKKRKAGFLRDREGSIYGRN